MNTNEDFLMVYMKYLEFSKNIAVRMVKNEAVAEDISQEVFYQFYVKAETIDISNERKLRALITTATLNKAKDYLKSSCVKREILSAENEKMEVPDSGELIDEMIVRKEENKEREKLLHKLREKNPMNYSILVQTQVFDVSPDEVAEEYGITRNNVNNRILRTRSWLKAEWKKMQKRDKTKDDSASGDSA